MVQVNGAPRATTVVSETQISAQLLPTDQASVGSLAVTVLNPSPGGGSSPATSVSVVYPAPGAIALMPNPISAGGAAPLAISVAGLAFAPASVVQVNGSARATTFLTSTQLTFELTVADQATVGDLSVAVMTPAPGGGRTAPVPLHVQNPLPVVTGLTPASLFAGSGTPTAITLSGRNFLSGTVATVNGVVHPITFVSATQLTVTLTAAEQANAGVLNLVLTNPTPGGGSSGAMTITLTVRPPLVLSSISPSVAYVGAGFTLQVLGSGFSSNSIVLWNGAPLPTQFKAGGELLAVVDAARVTATGAITINVKNSMADETMSPGISLPIENPARNWCR